MSIAKPPVWVLGRGEMSRGSYVRAVAQRLGRMEHMALVDGFASDSGFVTTLSIPSRGVLDTWFIHDNGGEFTANRPNTASPLLNVAYARRMGPVAHPLNVAEWIWMAVHDRPIDYASDISDLDKTIAASAQTGATG